MLAGMLGLLLCAAIGAQAAPALTDGTTTGWIGENGHLFLECADGAIRKMETVIADLPALSETELFCRTQGGSIYAVMKDGSSSRVANETEVEAVQAQKVSLAEGTLTFNGVTFATGAVAAAEDGNYIYYVESQEKSGYFLRVTAKPGETAAVYPGSDRTERDERILALDMTQVAEPLSLTVTADAVTLTGKDHGLTVFSLESGGTSTFAAASVNTASACLQNGTLYRYTQDASGAWIPEKSEAGMILLPDATATPAPSASAAITAANKPTATPAPTATSKPAATATPKPTATPTPDDGSVYRGASGTLVRRIQSRLAELGYPTGKVDGVYGSQTQVAINLFCNAIHVKERNHIPESVQTKLFSGAAPYYDPFLPLGRGDEGLSVRYMQERLRELGYDPGEIDGVYGTKTVEAVARYQHEHAIYVAEGEIPGEYASHEMLENLYAPGPTPTVPSSDEIKIDDEFGGLPVIIGDDPAAETEPYAIQENTTDW